MSHPSIMKHVATSSRSYVDSGCTRDYTSQFSATRTFESKEKLTEWAKDVGRSNNITVVVLRSDNGKGKKKPGVTLGCERSGKCDRRNTPEKTMIDKIGRRHTGTKKTDCGFKLRGKMLAGKWQLTVVEGKHNHEAEDTAGKQLGHSFKGRLSQEENSLVKNMYEQGKQPNEILRELKKRNKDNKSTPTTIYNACQRLKRVEGFKFADLLPGGHPVTPSPVSAICRNWWDPVICPKFASQRLKAVERRLKRLDSLEETSSRLQQLMRRQPKEYGFIIKKHETSPKMETASGYLLTHRTSLELLFAFPTVLRVQSARRPRWALLEVYGVTPTNECFFVALAFTTEHGGSYEWALTSLRDVMNDYLIAMPDIVILDIWEDKNLKIEVAPTEAVFDTAKILLSTETIPRFLDHAEKSSKLHGMDRHFFLQMWGFTMASRTEAHLEQHVKQLRTGFHKEYPEAVEYVIDTLLKPCKEMFVPAWTDKVMHFGTLNADIWNEWRADDIMQDNKYYYDGVDGHQTEIDKFWEELHQLIEDDNSSVKASLEESLENEYSDHRMMPQLKKLHGTISIHALKLIFWETIVASGHCFLLLGKDCSCAIRSTHGLPCKHDIAKYIREDQPIPLECINSYWRNLRPFSKTAEPIVEGRFKRRRLSEEKNTITDSGLALPDIVESELNSPNAGPSTVPSTQARQPDDEEYDIPSTKQLEFADVCPPEMKPYILEVKDVPRDGHCGFRVIASLLGFTDDDGWKRVRKDLGNELGFNADHYAHLFGSKQKVDDLLRRLDYLQITCPEKEHWMTMPDMGHIIASCYNVVLMHLSSVQCLTFFPLRTAPAPVSSPKEIAIGFCDEHFVQVLFKENTHPMPPPAALLTKREPSVFDTYQQQRSAEWATPYNARMKQFSSSLQPIVVSHENPIDLDTN